jgi:hypothetical protein
MVVNGGNKSGLCATQLTRPGRLGSSRTHRYTKLSLQLNETRLGLWTLLKGIVVHIVMT